MIDLYAWKTDNCRKISIMLEECEQDYNIIWINILNKEQFESSFLQINPNNKVPVLVDNNQIIVESGSILIYLAEKYNKLFSRHQPQRSDILSWLMFQLSAIGPTFGQAYHFKNLDFDINQNQYALKRFEIERDRILNVIEKRLIVHDYLAEDYSIADIATYPWMNFLSNQIDLGSYDYILKWMKNVSDRPAVQRGMKFGYKAK